MPSTLFAVFMVSFHSTDQHSILKEQSKPILFSPSETVKTRVTDSLSKVHMQLTLSILEIYSEDPYGLFIEFQHEECVLNKITEAASF